MSRTDKAIRVAVCENVACCTVAAADEALEWYGGPGEYCPECGEALSLRDSMAAKLPVVPAEPQSAVEPTLPQTRSDGHGRMLSVRRWARRTLPTLRWLWIFLGILVASAAAVYSAHQGVAGEHVASTSKPRAIEGGLSPCAIRPMTDATRSACTPFHIRDVLNERERLYERCKNAYRAVTPQLSTFRRTYCLNWSNSQTSVAIDGTVESRDADPLTTQRISLKRSPTKPNN